MGSDPHQVTVPDSLDGLRFDKALAALTDLSRSHARRLIEAVRAKDPSKAVQKRCEKLLIQLAATNPARR